MDLIYLSIILAGISFSSFGFFEKYYLFKYLDSYNVILIRNILISINLSLYAIFLYFYNRKKIVKFQSKKEINKFKIIFYLYSIIYFFTIYTIFKAFENKPASKVSLISQISMTIGSSVIGYFVFKEEFNNYNLLGVLFSIIGLILIMYK